MAIAALDIKKKNLEDLAEYQRKLWSKPKLTYGHL